MTVGLLVCYKYKANKLENQEGLANGNQDVLGVALTFYFRNDSACEVVTRLRD